MIGRIRGFVAMMRADNPHTYKPGKKREVGKMVCQCCGKQVELVFTEKEYCDDCCMERKIQRSWC